MMPKGVEHLYFDHSVQARELVRIPMMPKGVEHQNATAHLKKSRK